MPNRGDRLPLLHCAGVDPLGGFARVDAHGRSHEFWLMDRLLKETVEFLGAALFLAAAVALVCEWPIHLGGLRRRDRVGGKRLGRAAGAGG